MLVIPAIDLKDGKCVRLRQGEMDDSTVYGNDPVAMAAQWVEQGARRLHLVDLNGAFAGKPMNGPVVEKITAAFPEIPVQIGGGIRDVETVKAYIDAGVQYVIIGTKAVHSPEFVEQLCVEYPGHVIVGLDAKQGKVAVDGWANVSEHGLIDMAKRFERMGVDSIIYTDISRDGMLSGVSLESTVELARAINIPVIASGGVTNLEDIQKLCAVENEGITGVITGRAIYEGTLDFVEAQKLADSLNG